jgi:hypothetical protein
MNKNAWSENDRADFDVLVSDALAEPVVASRVDVFLAGLDRAVKAKRYWALDCRNDMRRRGAEKVLTNEQALRTPRVPVTQNGVILGKAPRELGRKIRDEEGKQIHARALFDFLTWDELREKRAEFARSARAAMVDRFTVEKLLSLEEKVPGAKSPADACRLLGTTVEEFLSTEEEAS